VLDVEVLGELPGEQRGEQAPESELPSGSSGLSPELPSGSSGQLPEPPARAEIERLCRAALVTAGVDSGHLAVEFVSAERIAQLNAEHCGKEGPTDVLSFPIDGVEPVFAAGPGGAPAGVPGSARSAFTAPPRELGDILICPEYTADLREAIVHGALHLVGMDHETDGGEMLALQARLLRGT
jgi:probable rRNA maturation factor